MKKILLVDDDATILEIYRQRFVQEGFEVETAADGLAAAQALRASKPDLVILDLMMPKLSGVDVIKFIRSQPALASTPVAIFTNSFMSELAEEAEGLGIQRTVIKNLCTPDALVVIAKQIFSGVPNPEISPAFAGASLARLAPSDAKSHARVRQNFLGHAPATLATLRNLYREFTQTSDPAKRLLQLEALFRKTHFTAALAGMADCHRIALLCGAFEALLFELQARPAHIDPSTLHTIARTVDFLDVLFDDARITSADQPLSAQVLIVDDDPLSNHLAGAALHRAHLNVRAAENPLTALELLKQKHYDLILLDIEMPHMTGFDLCTKLRALPGYAKTPVIYVTAHSDFVNRAKSVLTGGNDLIAKPVFPIELAVKAVLHLIKSRLPANN